MLRRRALLGAALTLGLAGSGCQPLRRRRGGPDGQRVISVSPNTTEALFALGLDDRLVGRSEHCDYPAAARELPSIGGFASPNIEIMLALQPTLVVGSRGPLGPVLAERLGGHGVDTWFPPTATAADIAALLRGLGKRFGSADRGEAAAAKLLGDLAAVEAWAAERPRPRSVMVFDVNPTFVAGPGGFPDELLQRAGGSNVITAGGPFPVVDVERLLILDPDVIIDAVGAGSGGPQRSQLPDAPGWYTLRAVQQRRVRRLRSDAALRPGPRLASGLADVAEALHGERPT